LITITATPDFGFVVTQFKVYETENPGNVVLTETSTAIAVTSQTFNMPAHNVTVEVSFTE